MNKKATEREIYYSAFVNKYKDAWKALRPKHRRIEYSILDCILHGRAHHRVTYERLPSESGKTEPAIAINILVSEPGSSLGDFSVPMKTLLDRMDITYRVSNVNHYCKTIIIDLVNNNMITHPLNLNSFDDMVDNLDACISDQLGETLFALPNTKKVKDILAKYQVEIFEEGICWILCVLKDYGREFDDEIRSFLPCVSHNISFSDYK